MNKHRMLQILFVLCLNIYMLYIYLCIYIFRCMPMYRVQFYYWMGPMIHIQKMRMLHLNVDYKTNVNFSGKFLYTKFASVCLNAKNTKFIVKLRKFNIDFTFIADKRGGNRIMYQSFVLPVSTQCRFEINLCYKMAKSHEKLFLFYFCFPASNPYHITHILVSDFGISFNRVHHIF